MADYLTPWYQALGSDCGIAFVTTDRDALRQRLYAARAKAEDPDLEGLSIVLSPTAEDQIWIVKSQ